MNVKHEDISQTINNLILNDFQTHPFSHGITIDNVENVLGQYLAMSQAFPYL